MGYYSLWLIFNATKVGLEQALKNFIPGYPQNRVYDTGADLVGKDHMEFTTPAGEKVIVMSLQEYKQLAIQLGVNLSS